MPHYANLDSYTPEEKAFWEAFCSCEGITFTTLTGLQFSFHVKGNELFFSRKRKSITRSTVMQAYRAAVQLVASKTHIERPKQLGVFGASYLYPVLKHLGVLPPDAPPVQMEFDLRDNLDS